MRVLGLDPGLAGGLAIFDGGVLMTGSYNWTRGAADFNNENFVVVGERRLIEAFQGTFERLWGQLGTNLEES